MEPFSQDVGNVFAGMPYPQGKYKAVQPVPLAFFYGIYQILRRFISHPLELAQLREFKIIYIAVIPYQFPIDQLVYHRLAEPLDIHRGARSEMDEALLQLRRTKYILAPYRDLTFSAFCRCVADATFLWHNKLLLFPRPA